jgi:hypothetical protein
MSALLVVKRTAPQWRAWQDSNAGAAATTLADLAAARQARRMLPTLRDSLRVRRELLATVDSNLTHASSAAIASVDVAMFVAELAAAAGVNVVSQQVVPDSTTAPGLHRVTIRLIGTSNTAGLAALLSDISGSERLVAVRELAVSQADPTASSRVETLRIEIAVDALCMLGAPRA